MSQYSSLTMTELKKITTFEAVVEACMVPMLPSLTDEHLVYLVPPVLVGSAAEAMRRRAPQHAPAHLQPSVDAD